VKLLGMRRERVTLAEEWWGKLAGGGSKRPKTRGGGEDGVFATELPDKRVVKQLGSRRGRDNYVEAKR